MMLSQTSLFKFKHPKPLVKVRYGKYDSIEEWFQKFHKANPHIYSELSKMALQLKRAGRNHYGIKSLFETLRFHSAASTVPEPYKLNNNFTAHYARLIMDNMSELENLFELRGS
jgi:hypothetical protein